MIDLKLIEVTVLQEIATNSCYTHVYPSQTHKGMYLFCVYRLTKGKRRNIYYSMPEYHTIQVAADTAKSFMSECEQWYENQPGTL